MLLEVGAAECNMKRVNVIESIVYVSTLHTTHCAVKLIQGPGILNRIVIQAENLHDVMHGSTFPMC